MMTIFLDFGGAIVNYKVNVPFYALFSGFEKKIGIIPCYILTSPQILAGEAKETLSQNTMRKTSQRL